MSHHYHKTLDHSYILPLKSYIFECDLKLKLTKCLRRTIEGKILINFTAECDFDRMREFHWKTNNKSQCTCDVWYASNPNRHTRTHTHRV